MADDKGLAALEAKAKKLEDTLAKALANKDKAINAETAKAREIRAEILPELEPLRAEIERIKNS